MAPEAAERRTLEAELAALSTEREKRAREKHDAAEAFRARTLRAHLARLGGRPGTVNDPSATTVVPWLPGEAWLAAQVVAQGSFRVRATLAALAEGDPDGRRGELARRVLAEDLLGPPLPESEALARALVDAGGGAPSVRDLARVLAREGRLDEARAEVARGAASDPSSEAELLLAEGEVELAAGRDVEAARALGGAWARGSAEAGLLLARRALTAGDAARARALGRAAALGPAGPARGLRAWGLASLPPPEPRLTDEPTGP